MSETTTTTEPSLSETTTTTEPSLSETTTTTEPSLSDRIMLTDADMALLDLDLFDEIVEFDDFTPTSNFC